MKRAIFLLTTMALALVVASGTAWAFDCAAGSCWGTPQGDLMIGTAADQGLHGRGGDDLIRGKGGNDFLTGDAGDDAVLGGSGEDLVEGNRGGDLVVGGSGADRVEGGKGSDALIDGLGRDVFKGGLGNDEIAPPGVGPGPPALYRQSDSIFCGPGEDRVIAHPLDEVADDCEVVRRIHNPFLGDS
jgi:RTX calcium-binding nonapeptide repeat (4 copies)